MSNAELVRYLLRGAVGVPSGEIEAGAIPLTSQETASNINAAAAATPADDVPGLDPIWVQARMKPKSITHRPPPVDTVAEETTPTYAQQILEFLAGSVQRSAEVGEAGAEADTIRQRLASE